MTFADIRIIEGDDSHIPELSRLWKDGFGDSDDYIDFFMKNKFSQCRTLIALHKCIPVGALYLMPLKTTEYDNEKHGYYLYALSVHSSFRNNSIGSSLVKRACNIADLEQSFIMLCPSEPSLCDYYRKLGFIENAYVSAVQINFNGSNEEFKCNELNYSDFFAMRNSNFKNNIIWDINSLKYILKENEFTGGDNLIVFHNTERYFAILEKNHGYITVLESDLTPRLRNCFSDYLCIKYGCKKILWILPDSEDFENVMLYGMTYNLAKGNYYFNHILN